MRVTILICGKATSGKTTFATILEELLNKNYTKAKVLHNAKAVKDLAKSFFYWDEEKDEKGRQLLIDITNSGYNYQDNFWERETELLFRRYSSVYEELEILIIPDWRYISTYDFFKQYGKIIPICIEKRSLSVGTHDSHSSENNFKEFPIKYQILNDGTIEDLKRFAKVLIEAEGLANVQDN